MQLERRGGITVGDLCQIRAIQVKVCWVLVMGVMLWVAGESVAQAGEAEGEKVAPPVDCRYETAPQDSAAKGSDSTVSIPFPDGDVFRPLFADPKQPQTFGSVQAVRNRDSKTSVTAGTVGFGENSDSIRADKGVTGGNLGFWPVSSHNSI